MNHHHRDLRRSDVRSSWAPLLARPVTDPEALAALVRKARAAGVVVFLKSELERMPDMARAIVEGEHRRICERR